MNLHSEVDEDHLSLSVIHDIVHLFSRLYFYASNVCMLYVKLMVVWFGSSVVGLINKITPSALSWVCKV